MSEQPFQKIVEEYTGKKILYRDFAAAIKNILDQLLADKKIKYQHITYREKDIETLAEKLDRKKSEGKEYKKLEQIEDLAGVRIVFYLESDKKKFLDLLYSEFRNVIAESEEKYKKGGYKATHLILKLDKSRAKLTEYSRFTNLKCELQLTSSLYHAWSEVEHDITYKQLDPNSKILQELGLKELESSFEKVMDEHIRIASSQLDYLQRSYKEIVEAGDVFGSDFVEQVKNAKSNDEIFRMLEIVKKYFHKKPEETLTIVNTTLAKKPLPAKVIHVFSDAKLYGKTHGDLELKCVELIEDLRYIKPDEVLNLAASLMRREEDKIKNGAKEIVKKFSKYDYNVLTKTQIGYGAQRKVLDFILAWSETDRLKNIDFVITAAQELLGSDIEGTSVSKVDTITFHSGAVDPTDFLKKLRRETVDILMGIYKYTSDTATRLRVIKTLEEASRSPSHAGYGDKVGQMILEDIQYLVGLYRKIIFDNKGGLVAELAITEEIEKRLYWQLRNKQYQTPEIMALRQDILKDPLYKIFRILVGDLITYKEEEGWDTADNKRAEEISKLIKVINNKTLSYWRIVLNTIANQRQWIEEWHFAEFKKFLRKLANLKPELANKLLSDAFKDNSPLKFFTNNFLEGFRDANRLDLWDKYVQKIIKLKDVNLTSAVIFSLNLDQSVDLTTKIRDKDMVLLKNITSQTKPFNYLKKAQNQVFHFALINTLVRNYLRNPVLIERLVIQEIKQKPEYLEMYLQELSFAIHRGWIDLTQWDKKNIGFLSRSMVNSINLEWHSQELLLAIGKIDIKLVFEVFKKRIRRDESKKIRQQKRRLGGGRYDPIPYHLNPDFKEFVSSHPLYVPTMAKWVENMTWEWSIYNWNVSHFLQRMEGSFTDILMSLVQKGDEDNLMKAARSLHSLEHADLKVCMEIVKRTNNRRIISQIDSVVYSTGVVSGEYGLAQAYENKAQQLEKYAKDKNQRIKKFALRMIKNFKASALTETRRTDEEHEIRKMDFEGI